jgi:hypothetical protein
VATTEQGGVHSVMTALMGDGEEKERTRTLVRASMPF